MAGVRINVSSIGSLMYRFFVVQISIERLELQVEGTKGRSQAVAGTW